MFCCRLILAVIIGCIMFISNTDGLVYRWFVWVLIYWLFCCGDFVHLLVLMLYLVVLHVGLFCAFGLLVFCCLCLLMVLACDSFVFNGWLLWLCCLVVFCL